MTQIANSIATLRTVTTFLDKIKQQAVVKPDNFNGFGGFVFDITENDSIQLQSDITDHFIEDNSAINDHIAIKPENVTVTGFTGELISREPQAISLLQPIADKLELISEYIPVFPAPLIQAYLSAKTAINTINEAAQGVEDLYSLFTNNNPEDKGTNQSKAFSFFYSMWSSREIFTVDTPFKTFTNMAIENMEVIQGDTVTSSEFTITFKKLRFATASVVNNNQGRRINQLGDLLNKGNTRGDVKAQSLLTTIAEGLGF
ncbi:hypothetical protein KAR91_59435 [Candidatus Pacearchaeota archaeon]|nr:hypothetical protein [Candidatus Pacearchaeota archaeon]